MNGPNYLLDTNILVAYVRQKPQWVRIRDQFDLFVHGPVPRISTVTEGELKSLANQRAWGKNKLDHMQFCLGYFAAMPPHHPSIIEVYATIDSWCVGNGYALSDNDLWIAATAIATDCVLLSMDQDFLPLADEFLRFEWIVPS